tara:strand:+ start:650 stop:859 length:210 start_codon:yes stop_codon:yes gene_type:complete
MSRDISTQLRNIIKFLKSAFDEKIKRNRGDQMNKARENKGFMHKSSISEHNYNETFLWHVLETITYLKG